MCLNIDKIKVKENQPIKKIKKIFTYFFIKLC